MSLLQEVWQAVKAIGTGMATVHKRVYEEPPTEFYPYVLPDLPPVSVQSLALVENEDGTERCIVCLQCERACPAQVITIERHRNPEGKGFLIDRFDIDLANCMYCSACVEACPVSSIVTIQDFEMSTYDLHTLKADIDFLHEQAKRSRQWYSPKFGVEIRTEDGRIEKAPPEMQPGGLAELLKPAEEEVDS